MEAISKVKIYTLNGVDTKVGEKTTLNVLNVWNKNKCVLIELDGKTAEVHADDLRKAIFNATDNERY